jgi:hypothetical protein
LIRDTRVKRFLTSPEKKDRHHALDNTTGIRSSAQRSFLADDAT